MPDRRETLTSIPRSLLEQALSLPSDHDIPQDMRSQLNAIDVVGVTGTAAIVAPSITPGTYIRLRREAAGLTIEDVAMMIDSFPQVSVQRRIEGLTMIEADVEPISPSTALVLHELIDVDLRILAYWMAIAEGATPLAVGVLDVSTPEPSA